jgi:hypothetical protein
MVVDASTGNQILKLQNAKYELWPLSRNIYFNFPLPVVKKAFGSPLQFPTLLTYLHMLKTGYVCTCQCAETVSGLSWTSFLVYFTILRMLLDEVR